MGIEGSVTDYTFAMIEPEECVVKANPAGDIVCYRNHVPGPDGHYFLTRDQKQLLMRGETQ